MQNGGQRNSQGRDMSQRIEVCRAGSIAHPQPFLTCGFEAGIVTLALCTQGVCPLETEAATVNGKSVVIGNGFIFRAAPVFPPVIPVLVVAGTNAGLGLAGTGSSISGGYAHCRWFCRPCAWRTRPRRPDYRQEAFSRLSCRVD